MTRLYIAGPMTGLPGYNIPAFHQAEHRLRDRGYDVLNPARWGVITGWTWRDYMRQAIRDIADADGLAVLPGWTGSRGATAEVDLARSIEIPVRGVYEWLPLSTGRGGVPPTPPPDRTTP